MPHTHHATDPILTITTVQYWVSVLLAVYGAALLFASPFCGYFADLITSRRVPLLFGLLLLTASTTLLAVGTSLSLWITGRVLQGLSSAIVWVSGLALLVDTVGPGDIGQFMGYVGASLSLALLLSPLLGGVVFDKAGYESVFGMCWGLLALDVGLRVVVVEKKIAVKWLGAERERLEANEKVVGRQVEGVVDEEKATSKLDTTKFTGQPSTTASAPSTPSPRPAAAEPPPAHISILPPVTTSKPKRPFTLAILLSSPRLLAALYGSLIQASLLTAFDSTLPLRVRTLFHWTSLGAGLIFLPITIPSFFGPLIGYWVDRRGPRIPATLSFLLAVPFLIILRLITADVFAQKAGLCALLAGLGASLAFALPALLAEMSNVVVEIEERKPGVFGSKGAFAQAYGLFNLAFAAGCLVGPVWGGLITQRAGWGTMTWTLGLLSGTTALPVFVWVGGAVWSGRGRGHARAVDGGGT